LEIKKISLEQKDFEKWKETKKEIEEIEIEIYKYYENKNQNELQQRQVCFKKLTFFKKESNLLRNTYKFISK
jgi:hypothetical protein